VGLQILLLLLGKDGGLYYLDHLVSFIGMLDITLAVKETRRVIKETGDVLLRHK
jgi:hypothetical protein